MAINLLIKPFYIFGIDRVVQNAVGPDVYGLFFVLVNFSFLFQIINDFGIQNFNNKHIAQHRQLLDKYVPNILMLKLLLGVLYFLVVSIVAWKLGYLPRYRHWLIWIAINHFLISMNFYIRSNVSALGFYRTDSILSVLDKLVMILICGYLLWVYHDARQFRIEWFIYAQTASFLVTTVAGMVIVSPHLKQWRFSFKPVFLLVILKESYPYALIVFLMTVYTKIDVVMIKELLSDGDYQAGVYASAYRLLDASNMIGFLFAGLLLPMFARMLKEKAPFEGLLQMSAQMIWAGALTVSITVFYFRHEIAFLLYDEATLYWGEVLGYLMITFVAVSGTYIFGTLLMANGSLMKMNLIFVFSILLNVVLNYYLIRYSKAHGAAIATIITQFFSLFAQMELARRLFNLRVNIKVIFRILAFGGVSIAGGYFWYNMTPFPWTVNIFGQIMLCGALAFLFRLIDLKAFLTFARTNNEE